VPTAAPASTQAAASGAARTGGTLQLGIADIGTLNPFVSNTVVENYILMMLYPTCATLDANSGRLPYVAQKWESSPDGLKHTITLNRGYQWEDGQPLTSQDVKFVADFEKKYQFSWKAALLDTVASIDTPDDYTVVFTMSQPVVSFLTEFTYWFRIMPKHIWETVPDPKTFTNDKPVGAGPFKFVQWQKGQFVELDARKDYNFPPTGRPPYIDKLIYRIYPDVNTLVLALQNGTIDAAPSGVPADSVDAVKGNPDLEVVHNASTGYNIANFNIAKTKPLADVRLRQALAMATDKASIVQLVLKGYGGAMTTSVSPVLKDWVDPSVKDWPFDIDGGKKILTDAGLGNVELRLEYSSSDANAQKIAPILQQNWQKLGLKITLDAQEGNALYNRVRYDRNFDIYLSGWGIEDDPPFDYYINYHSSQYQPGSNNFIGLQDPAFDDMIAKAYHATSLDQAKQFIKQAQAMEHQLLPGIALYYPEFLLAYNKKRWAGFTVLPGSLMGIASFQSMANVHQI
jgi:peptide/nickel transport system substrate-binding protein